MNEPRWRLITTPLGPPGLDPTGLDGSLPDTCLVVFLSEDRSAVRCLDLQSGRATIGRDERCDLPLLTDDAVSRRHAVVERVEDRWILRDESRNGTLVNGQRVVKERVLKDGDRLRMGRTVMAFLWTGGEEGGAALREELADVWRDMVRDAELAFPLAVLRPLVSSHPAPVDRVRALLEAIDNALRYFAAVLVGALFSKPGRQSDVIGALRTTLDAGLPWERAVFRLAPLTADEPHLVQCAFGMLRRTVRGAGLEEALRVADGVREDVVPRRDLAPEAHADDEPFLRDLLHAVLESLSPLSAFKLVSVARIIGFGRQGSIRYELHQHDGPCELFPVAPAAIRAQLLNEWCYLLRPGTDDEPISLAPFVRFGLCSACGRSELALAEQVVLGPARVSMRVRSVTTGHTSRVLVPDDEHVDALHRAFGAPYELPREPSIPPPLPLAPAPPPRATQDPPRGGERSTGYQPPRVLFFGASPKDVEDIDPEEELHAIKDALDRGFADGVARGQVFAASRAITVLPQLGLRASELQTALDEATLDDCVHISAHGSPTGQLYLRGEAGTSALVDAADLVQAVRQLDQKPACLILCSCYSLLAQTELPSLVGCVIGMKSTIDVASARSFCSAFYHELALGRSVQSAFERGRVQIGIVTEGDADDARAPELLAGTRDPKSIFLVQRNTRYGE